MRRTLTRSLTLCSALPLTLMAQQSWGQTPTSTPNPNPYDETRFIDDIDLNFYADGRIRYQTLEQDSLPETAEALTVSIQTGLELDIPKYFSALVEIEASEQLIDDFNDGVNGELDFPTLLDVADIELNRLQLQTELIPKTRLTVGRQRLALDNWRFLGRWEFRQNDQTFDAVRGEISLGKGYLNLGAFNKVLRHLGDDNPVGEFSGGSYIANYNHPLPLGQVTLFHYALDLETGPEISPINIFSNQTTGARWHGRRNWDQYGLAWDFSLAQQSDFADNPNDYSALYWDIGAELQYDRFKLDLGLEVLGSDDGVPVITPLGSLHGFQGVTDRFFNTPPDGLRDLHASIKTDFGQFGPIEHIQAKIGYHEFSSDEDRRDYGEEFNFSLTGKIGDFTLLLELGDYQTKADINEIGLFASDARTAILSTAYSFD